MLLLPVLFGLTCSLALPANPSSLLPEDDAKFELKEKIVYSKVGDRELLLDAYLPVDEGPHPAVLVVHGGAWKSGNRKQLASYATSLAKKKIVCFAIDYRLAPEHKFPAQIDDCREAVKWVRKNSAVY